MRQRPTVLGIKLKTGQRSERRIGAKAAADPAIGARSGQRHTLGRSDRSRAAPTQAARKVRGEASPVDLAHARIQTGQGSAFAAFHDLGRQRLQRGDRYYPNTRAEGETLSHR